MFLARIDIIQKGLDFLLLHLRNLTIADKKVKFHFYGKARTPQYAKEFEQYVNNASNNVFFMGQL